MFYWSCGDLSGASDRENLQINSFHRIYDFNVKTTVQLSVNQIQTNHQFCLFLFCVIFPALSKRLEAHLCMCELKMFCMHLMRGEGDVILSDWFTHCQAGPLVQTAYPNNDPKPILYDALYKVRWHNEQCKPSHPTRTFRRHYRLSHIIGSWEQRTKYSKATLQPH